MNIVLIGAGDIGIHLASVLAQMEYGIVLVDTNPHKLEQIGRELDVVTRVGSGTDWELLEELMEFNPDLLIALTNDDETNLVACSIAKSLGYPQTISKVRSNKFLDRSRLNFEQLFSVDYLISPERLTANAIANMIIIPDSISTENFANGAVQMRTVTMPAKWKKGGTPLTQREALQIPEKIMVGLIRRPLRDEKGRHDRESLIFPHGSDTLEANDEVTFIGEVEGILGLHKFLGTSPIRPKSVIIVGGSLIGVYLAKILEQHGISIRIIEKDYDKCISLSETLPSATVIHHDGTDMRFLQSEGVGETDVFVASTRNDEINFLSASAAKELGCPKAIISLSDTGYIPLVSRLGIDQAASPRINVANKILSIAREKTISSMVSMYNNKAEIMEVKVSMDSKIAGIPIHELGPHLPKDFLIVVIQSRGRIFIANGSRVLSPGDTVIVISSPKYTHEIKRLF